MRAPFLLLLATCGGCWTPDQPGATAADSAGVAVVQNRGADRPLNWSLESLVIIRDGDGAVTIRELTE